MSSLIVCPHAASDFTPCIARDGAICLAGDDLRSATCVGCGQDPHALLHVLAERYPPAKGAPPQKARAADHLKACVAAYVDGKGNE